MQTLIISKPDDFHLHLRDGAAMASVINYSAAQFSRAIVMPNLVQPIINVDMAMLYRERILHCVDKKFNLVVWPKTLKYKDINDIIISGKTSTEIQTLISSNTYCGLTALQHINNWKGI